METRIVKLKSDFNNIINIRNSVKNIFDILQLRIDKLKIFYSEFVKNNKTEMFVFGLDSFHFQSKLIDIEYDDTKRLFIAINNRMYCEYFKLNKIIIDYILNNITDNKITELIKVNNFPIYKDLEPFKEYKFETILEIHENILNLLSSLMSLLNNKENELSIHMTKKNIGLNIDNFITSFNYNNLVMREKILMFITYIEFFHSLHTKYLKRFSNKIQLMYSHIKNDIKFDDSVETNNNSKDIIDDFNFENMDLEISSAKSIKSEIGKNFIKLNTFLNKSEEPDNNSEYSSITNENSFNINNLIPLEGEIVNKEKKNFSQVIQKKIKKVSDMLQLCKKNKNIIEPKMLNINNKIEQAFCNYDVFNNVIGENDVNEIITEQMLPEYKIEEMEPILELNEELIEPENLEEPKEVIEPEKLEEEKLEEPIEEKLEEENLEEEKLEELIEQDPNNEETNDTVTSNVGKKTNKKKKKNKK